MIYTQYTKVYRVFTQYQVYNHIKAFITLISLSKAMLGKILRFAFSTPKQQYSRLFVIRLHFPTDGYYESNQYRPKFIDDLASLQKKHQAILLGGDSFPFGITTLYLNCQDQSIAQQLAHKNIFVEKGLAKGQITEIQRVGKNKIGLIAQFYQMKMEL